MPTTAATRPRSPIVTQQTGQTIWYCYSNAADGSVKTETGGTFDASYHATC